MVRCKASPRGSKCDFYWGTASRLITVRPTCEQENQENERYDAARVSEEFLDIISTIAALDSVRFNSGFCAETIGRRAPRRRKLAAKN